MRHGRRDRKCSEFLERRVNNLTTKRIDKSKSTSFSTSRQQQSLINQSNHHKDKTQPARGKGLLNTQMLLQARKQVIL